MNTDAGGSGFSSLTFGFLWRRRAALGLGSAAWGLAGNPESGTDRMARGDGQLTTDDSFPGWVRFAERALSFWLLALSQTKAIPPDNLTVQESERVSGCQRTQAVGGAGLRRVSPPSPLRG